MLKPLLLWCSVGFLMCMAHVTFTNLRCSALNESLTEIKQCRIKAFNRTHKYIMFHSNLKVKPVNNVTINFKLMRYDHGYKPFFVDITIDGCKFMKNPRNLIIKMLYDTIKHFTNMNHTCPYNHDIIVDRFWTGNHDLNFDKFMPIPNGDYALNTTFYVHNFEHTRVEVYMTITR